METIARRTVMFIKFKITYNMYTTDGIATIYGENIATKSGHTSGGSSYIASRRLAATIGGTSSRLKYYYNSFANRCSRGTMTLWWTFSGPPKARSSPADRFYSTVRRNPTHLSASHTPNALHRVHAVFSNDANEGL